MREQLLTKVHQAKLHLQRGDAGRALELFESARALARGDREMLLQILPDLVRCYYETGKDEQAQQYEEHLDYLRGNEASTGPSAGLVTAISARPRRGRRLAWGAATIVVALLVAGGAAYLVHRAGTERYAATPSDVAKNVGLLIRVGRYTGEVNGNNVVAEIPLASGTCFAVHRNGLLLTDRDLVADDPARTPSVPFVLHPKLTLSETRLCVYFGPPTGEPEWARIVRHLQTADLTLLKVNREFDRPLTLSQRVVSAGEAVRVLGYPAGPAGLLEANRIDDTLSKLELYLLTGDTVRVDRWVPAGAYQCADAEGAVVDAGQFIDGAPHVLLRATTGPGHQGAPVLNEFQNVVGVIAPVAQAAGQLGAAGAGYAIPTSRVARELDTVLSEL